jgi:hypothetical protein
VLHNQTAAVMVAYLRLSGFQKVVVINVPWYLSDEAVILWRLVNLQGIQG